MANRIFDIDPTVQVEPKELFLTAETPASLFDGCHYIVDAVDNVTAKLRLIEIAKELNIPTIVSLNPIMVDGTGMCGGCRLTVGGETKFACVDGPDFDGHLVDFDEALERGSMYKPFERHAHEETCNLFKKEVQ